MKNLKVTHNGRVVGEAVVDSDGIASAVIFPEAVKEIFPGYAPHTNLSIDERAERVRPYLDVDINWVEIFAQNRYGGTFSS